MLQGMFVSNGAGVTRERTNLYEEVLIILSTFIHYYQENKIMEGKMNDTQYVQKE